MNPAAHANDVEIERLRKEVEELRCELERYKSMNKLQGRAALWLMTTWLGADIKVATRNLGSSLGGWQEGKSPLPMIQFVDFVGAIAARFTRVGLFRIGVAVLIAAATLWFSIAQVQLLKGQNQIAALQSRAQLADFISRLKAQREATLLSLAEAGQIWVQHSAVEIYAQEQHAKRFREQLLLAVGNDVKAAALMAQCDYGLLPFSSADKALRVFDLTGRVSDAKWDVEQALLWWASLREGCSRKSAQLYEQQQEFERELAVLTLAGRPESDR